MNRQRTAGVILHPTCLPSRLGIGDLAPTAAAYVEWLAAARAAARAPFDGAGPEFACQRAERDDLGDRAAGVGDRLHGVRHGEPQFVVADIALSSYDGVWLAGLPETATIITVGQGYVAPGSVVAAIPERDVETAVAIKDNEETD